MAGSLDGATRTATAALTGTGTDIAIIKVTAAQAELYSDLQQGICCIARSCLDLHEERAVQ